MNFLKKTLIYIIFPLIVISFLFLIVFSYFRFNYLFNEFKTEADLFAKLLGESFQDLLIDDYFEEYNEVFDNYLKFSNANSFSIYNSDNVMLISKRRSNDTNLFFSNELSNLFFQGEDIYGSYVLTKDISSKIFPGIKNKNLYSNVMIGRIETSFSYSLIFNKLVFEVVILFIASFAFIGFLFLFIFYQNKKLNLFKIQIGSLIQSRDFSKNIFKKGKYSSQVLEIQKILIKAKKDYFESLKSEKIAFNSSIKSLYKKIEEMDNSNRRLRDSHQSSTAFLAGICHDIRNPISGIFMQVDMLLKTKLSDSQLDKCNHIKNSANQLINLVEEILDYSRLESMIGSIESRPVDLINLIEKNMIDSRSLIKNKDLNIFIVPNENVPNYISLDQSMVSRVISNLLSNVIRYAHHGNIAIKIFSESIESNNSFKLRVEVQDRDHGIPKNKIDDVFLVYYREEAGLIPEKGNEGLGLSIARGLVKKMNGRTGIYYDLDQGPTFWFEIPSKVISYLSPSQTKIMQEYKESNIDLAIINKNPVFLDSILAQFNMIGVKPKVYSENEAIRGSHDLMMGYMLSENPLLVKRMKAHAKKIISIENKGINEIEKSSLIGIDEVMDKNKPAYRAVKKMIQLKQEAGFNSIGLSQAKESLAIINPLMDIIGSDSNKVLSGCSVLLINDNEFSGQGILDGLHHLGASVDYSKTFNEGKKKINKHVFDVIVTDFNLDEGTGIDIADSSKNSLKNQGTPVICLTGDVMIKDDPEAQRVFSSILIKPYTEEKLLQAIMKNRL